MPGEGSSHARTPGVKLTDNPGVSDKRTNDFLADDDAFVLHEFSSTTWFGPNSPSSLPVVATHSMDLTSRRTRLRLISELESQVDLRFSDNVSSLTSNLERCTPSIEALIHAKMAVRNFLGLGLHQLGESQRLVMLSSISILKTSPEFAASEFDILDGLSTIFSQSDAAFATSADMISHRTSFQNKCEKKGDLDNHDKMLHEKIVAATVSYDAEEAEVKRLEEENQRRRARMVTLLDEAETLEATMLDNRRNSQAIGQQLLSLKDDYQIWIRKL
ncbi:uncharacterized protein [Primulina huaijiensis]|uniref:uncharacterized protein n=1 Tax=Primulina huaijiensis TaxID=1492673 RepID=UPI003CC71064